MGPTRSSSSTGGTTTTPTWRRFKSFLCWLSPCEGLGMALPTMHRKLRVRQEGSKVWRKTTETWPNRTPAARYDGVVIDGAKSVFVYRAGAQPREVLLRRRRKGVSFWLTSSMEKASGS